MSKYPTAQNPLLLRYHRLMDAFAKSDDERDFYLDKVEGFIVYVDLDKGPKEIEDLEYELSSNPDRYCILPKMTFYETKKFMEGFVNEKVYDIDTKEKLLDIIQSKEARENFLEFIYDHLGELEKWQQYYVERSRIRIIEWLRSQNIQFVFEEDLDINKSMMEKLKRHLFDAKVPKEIATVRETLIAKAKTYYSNEALNPRPKRGRPPKQVAKVEVEPQVSVDMYTTVPPVCRMFLYLPEITSAASVTFSAKFDTEAQLLASLRGSTRVKVDTKLQALSERLESLRHLSSKLAGIEDITGGAEGRLIKAVSSEKVQEEPEEDEDDQAPKKRRIMEVVKGFLPGGKKKEKPSKGPEAPVKKGIKMVTQIQKHKKK
ncbi:MAG: UPF0158 family protein [Candidatus Melainabacteria bacterium]|nr:UPF0158 family protein [Candidatus Melainabacteria bacterium]